MELDTSKLRDWSFLHIQVANNNCEHRGGLMRYVHKTLVALGALCCPHLREPVENTRRATAARLLVFFPALARVTYYEVPMDASFMSARR